MTAPDFDPAQPQKAIYLVVFRATRGGTCRACGQPIRVGEYIAQQQGPWLHLACQPIIREACGSES